MNASVRKLLDVLDIERVEENLFRGMSADPGWQRVFGGQVIAQGLVAAQRTVPPERPCHSLHAYFILPGDPAAPIVYQVERLRDGGSFTTRRVEAIQHGRAIFTLSASFQRVEAGLSHQAAMPDAPVPESISHGTGTGSANDLLAGAPEAVRRYWERPRPIEIRPISLDHYLSNEKLDPEQRVWMRASADIGDDPALNQAVLAYLSDMTLLDTSLFAHGLSVFDARVQAASLDHAMWFHAPARVSHWMLYWQDSPVSGGSRGLTRGSIFARDGTLLASVAQEGLIRLKDRHLPK